MKLDRNPNTQQQLRKDIEPDGENLDDETFRKEIHDAYTRMSVWRRNVFQVTNGSIGKSFMNELTTNLDLWNNNSPYRNVALKMFMLLPNLSLQRESHKSKTNDNKDTLERRLALWKHKNISTLVVECLVIKSRMRNGTATKNTNIGEMFQKQMVKCNVNGTLQLLTNDQCKGILQLDDITMNEIHIKHLEASPMYDDLLIQGAIVLENEAIFSSIDESEIL